MKFISLWLLSCGLVAVGADKSPIQTPLTTLSIPERPEGITNGPGSTVFVSQILSGKVLQIDVLTGEQNEVVGAQDDRQAWGLWYLDGKILVAGGGPSFGGGTPEVYVYDVATGVSVAACQPVALNVHGAFMNDVTIQNGVAYATDSVNGKLMAMDAAKAFNGTCDVWAIDLPDNFDPVEPDDFGANGVVGYADGLLVGHELDGSVWHVGNLGRGNNVTFQEVIPDGGAAFADGLTVKNNMLYVTQNLENVIGVFELSKYNDMVKATFVANLTSPDFATPATSAIYGEYIYSTNSRFAELPEISDPANNTVIGVRLTKEETSDAIAKLALFVPALLLLNLFCLLL